MYLCQLSHKHDLCSITAPSLCAINKNGNERNKVTKLINRTCIKGCLVVLIVSEGMLPWDTKLNFSITVSSNEGASLIRHNPASIIVSTNGLPRGGLFSNRATEVLFHFSISLVLLRLNQLYMN